jgi:hypothetical protein
MNIDLLDFSESENISDQLNKFIGDREILILENDNTLVESILNFYSWCVHNKKPVNTLYSIDELPLTYIDNMIYPNIVIAFMTTGIYYELVEKLKNLIISKKDYRLKIIECYIYEPNFYYLPDEVGDIEMMSLDCFNEEVKNWKLKYLTKR